jgi:hypothetical protein
MAGWSRVRTVPVGTQTVIPLGLIGKPGPALCHPEKKNPPFPVGDILSSFKAVSCVQPITGSDFCGHFPLRLLT